MTLLHYHDGLRVVISTANMIERDWTYKTQGAFIPLAKLASQCAGVYLTRLLPYTFNAADSTPQPNTHASPFRDYLLTYLRAYGKNVVPTKWIDYILAADFDSVQVRPNHLQFNSGTCFAECSSNRQRPWRTSVDCCCGQAVRVGCATHARRARRTRHSCAVDSSARKCGRQLKLALACARVHTQIAQFSSIGSLGGKCDQWLRPQLAAAMGAGSVSAPVSTR
jgi:hypothetical protein